MASNVIVIDSSFKRTQIKVSPGMPLREVLEEACKSRKLSPDAYMLKTQNGKAVDLSQPFRLSGLTAGAKLQLTQGSKSPGVVSVALQLPESEGGGRLSDKFPSTTSLWLVLRKYEDAVAGAPSRKLNLTQRGVPSGSTGAGRLMYEQPSLNLIGRNLESFTDLQKTLGQLGLNGGSALIRLNFKVTEQPLEEAMREISDYFGTVDTSSSTGGEASASQVAEGAHANTKMESVPDAAAENAGVPAEGAAGPEPNDDITASEGPTAQPVENDIIASSSVTEPEPAPTSEEPTPPNNLNGISVFSPPTTSTPYAATAPDDPNAFDPTIDHAKAHQAALTRSSQNKRLASDAELAAAESSRQQSLAAITSATVRVRYPDQSQIELTVTVTETGADLYARVRATLAAGPDAPFELRYVGTKTHETLPDSDAKRLVRDAGFRGKVLVTLVWGDRAGADVRRGPSLRPELREQARELKVDLTAVQREGERGHGEAMAGGKGGEGEGKKKGGGGDVEAKMKKFLGFGKK